MSRDPKWRVGAILVSEDGRRMSMGFNGLVRGLAETPENWVKPKTHTCIKHAETNALAWADFDKRGSTLYCVLKPCSACLGDAINCGVARIVWLSMDQEASDEYYGSEWFELAKLIKTSYYKMDNKTKAIIAAYGAANVMIDSY